MQGLSMHREQVEGSHINGQEGPAVAFQGEGVIASKDEAEAKEQGRKHCNERANFSGVWPV